MFYNEKPVCCLCNSTRHDLSRLNVVRFANNPMRPIGGRGTYSLKCSRDIRWMSLTARQSRPAIDAVCPLVHYIHSSPVFIHNRRNRSRLPATGGRRRILLRLKKPNLMRKTAPVARRVFGENHETTLKISGLTPAARGRYATLDDLASRTTLEDADGCAARARRRASDHNGNSGGFL